MIEMEMLNADPELFKVLQVLGDALDRQGIGHANLLGRRWDNESSEVQIHLQDKGWDGQSKAIDAALETRGILFDEGIFFAYSLGPYWPAWDS